MEYYAKKLHILIVILLLSNNLSLSAGEKDNTVNDELINEMNSVKATFEEVTKSFINSIRNNKLNNSFKGIQPLYKKWNQIEKNMTYPDVEKILGKPIEKPFSNLLDKNPYLGIRTIYGIVVKKSDIIPEDLCFYVYFMGGKVVEKTNPFGYKTLPNKSLKPATPKMLSPPNNMVWDNNPYIMDLRCYPAFGKYPMYYIFEIDYYNFIEKEWVYDLIASPIPHVSVSLTNFSRYRWRIKAINSLGESLWSKYRYFSFNNPKDIINVNIHGKQQSVKTPTPPQENDSEKR